MTFTSANSVGAFKEHPQISGGGMNVDVEKSMRLPPGSEKRDELAPTITT
jgi:hypothetical protein